MIQEYYNIPLGFIYKLICQEPKREDEIVKIEIVTKDYRKLILLFADVPTAMQLFENLKKLCFPGTVQD